ncbi:MAG TPA: outer membrane beta-barrel protein [Gemmatimonas sp.]|uniref:outer membrane protein n=1 Tax=Gemmatimonas sp. TaxID=1962908 RepID=UPI002ED7E4D7
MKRALRMFGLAAAIAAPAALSAQASSDKPVSFGVSGGLSLPMSDLGDAAESGFTAAGHIYFKPASMASLGFRGDVSYDRWTTKFSDDVNLRSLGFVANALYSVNSSSMVKPYLLGGVGMFNSKASVDLGSTSGDTESSNDLGIQVGGGLRFQLSGFSTFLEAKYVNVFGDGDASAKWVPITFGIRF